MKRAGSFLFPAAYHYDSSLAYPAQEDSLPSKAACLAILLMRRSAMAADVSVTYISSALLMIPAAARRSADPPTMASQPYRYLR